MSRLYRFLILSIVGFVLGAGLAYVQVKREAQNAPASVIEVGEKAAEESKTDIGTAPTEMALNTAADDVGAAEAVPVAADPTKPAVAGAALGGPFSLTDHNGVAVTHESWPDKYKLVFFGFTHCPDICPAALDKITTALKMPGVPADRIQPLFITIDPSRDKPEVMKEYLAAYHPSILGLTGTDDQLKQAEGSYKVYAAKVDGADAENYTMAHSSYVFLMSPTDELLDIFKDEDPASLMAEKISARFADQP